MAVELYICLLIWITLLNGTLASYRCYNYRYSRTYYCDHGCCGDDYDKSCCAYSSEGLIAGCVVAGIVVIAIIVIVVLAYLKKTGRAGKIFNRRSTVGTTNQAMTVTPATTHGNTTVHAPPAYGQQPIGQPYGQPYGQPAYGQQPAYPPPGQAQYPPPPAGMYNNPAYPPK